MSNNNNTARDYSEKRDFIRMKVKTNMSLRLPTGQQVDAECEDLSATGMSVKTNTALPLDTECHATIPSQNPSFPPLDSTVKVVRCNEQPGGGYDVGLVIVDIQK